MEPVKSKFDFINFAYGVGAAIILIAAMFKFLGWDYANEIFIVGLTTEAIVFLISAFQWKVVSSGYKWENIFPQLTKDTTVNDEKIDLSKNMQQYYKNTESVTRSVEALEKTINNLTEVSEGLTKSVLQISNQMSRLESSSQNYEDELNNLKERLSRANTFYSEMIDLVEEN
jgi:methyl-accepting chemotaxis protein